MTSPGGAERKGPPLKSTAGQVEVDDQSRATQKRIGTCHHVGVGRMLPAHPPPAVHAGMCGRALRQAGSRRVRRGSAATNRQTGIGSLLAGQSDAALAPISRGVRRRDLARTRRPLPPNCGGGRNGRRGASERGTLRARLAPRDNARSLPLEHSPSGARRYAGWQATRACFFRSKPCHFAPCT